MASELSRLLKSLVLKPRIVGELASRLTAHIAPGRLALQISPVAGDLIVDVGFRGFFPGVGEGGGLTAVWQTLAEKPEYDYAESRNHIFVRFKDGHPNLDGEYILNPGRRSEAEGGEQDAPPPRQGRIFYFGEFTIAESGDYGFLSGARVLWLLDATEDLRLKRQQRRSEVAARAILDRLYSAGAFRPREFSFKDLPKNGESRVGGDFYYLRRFPEDERQPLERVCLVVGDCTGHGVGGALLSTMAGMILQGFFRGSRNWHTTENPALHIVRHLHQELKSALTEAAGEADRSRRAYATPGAMDGCVIVVDYKREPGKACIFAAGGNVPVWLVRKTDGLSSSAAVSTVLAFDPEGPPKSIGVSDNLSQGSSEEAPARGERGYYDFIGTERTDLRIVVATDGFHLQHDRRNRQLGVACVPGELYKTRAESSAQVVKDLLGFWSDFKGDCPQEDDLLLVVLDLSQPRAIMSGTSSDGR